MVRYLKTSKNKGSMSVSISVLTKKNIKSRVNFTMEELFWRMRGRTS